MILNVNRILHTPGASQDFHFEMDLSDLEFGGERPVVHPVAVDGKGADGSCGCADHA